GKKLVKTNFLDCSIKNAIFTDADLTKAVFNRADLAGTVFSHTLLKEADFTTAINYALDPALNVVKKAKFSLYGLPGLLAQYDIKVQNRGGSEDSQKKRPVNNPLSTETASGPTMVP